jgi:hypothetical protein
MWPYIQQETEGAALDQVHSLPAKALVVLLGDPKPQLLTIIMSLNHL